MIKDYYYIGAYQKEDGETGYAQGVLFSVQKDCLIDSVKANMLFKDGVHPKDLQVMYVRELGQVTDITSCIKGENK